jgi:hypothetical protein
MSSRRFGASLAVASLLASGCLLIAQSDANKGKQIVDKAVAALGGDGFLHMRNRVTVGRIYAFFHDRLSGLDVTTTYTEYLPSRPAKGLGLREREVLGKKQDYSYLFLPDQAFDVTYRGARPLPDESWQRSVRITEDDILYILKVRHDEPGMLYDYIGSDVYLSTHCEVVDLTDAQSRTVRVFFDHNTLLPIHQSFTWMDPDTKEHNEDVTNFDKYRDIGGGIMWPYTIERERNGYRTYQMFARTIEANQSIPPKTFELPPGAKILKKVD